MKGARDFHPLKSPRFTTKAIPFLGILALAWSAQSGASGDANTALHGTMLLQTRVELEADQGPRADKHHAVFTHESDKAFTSDRIRTQPAARNATCKDIDCDLQHNRKDVFVASRKARRGIFHHLKKHHGRGRKKTYFIGSLGSTSCPQGSHVVMDLESCIHAAQSLGIRYGRDDYWTTGRYGCFTSANTAIHFQKKRGGGRHQRRGPICWKWSALSTDSSPTSRKHSKQKPRVHGPETLSLERMWKPQIKQFRNLSEFTRLATAEQDLDTLPPKQATMPHINKFRELSDFKVPSIETFEEGGRRRKPQTPSPTMSPTFPTVEPTPSPPGDPCVWYRYSGYYCDPLAGDHAAGSESVAACKQRCQNDGSCYAITYYANEERCYTFEGSCNLASSGSGGVVYKCARQSPTLSPTPSPSLPTAEPTLSSTPSPSPPAAEPTQTPTTSSVPPGGPPRGGPQGMDAPAPCEWHQYPGMYCRPISGDGTGDESVEACKASCQQTRDCGAITWYANQQRCYLAQGECEMADSGAALLQGAGSDSVVHTCDRVPTPSPTVSPTPLPSLPTAQPTLSSTPSPSPPAAEPAQTPTTSSVPPGGPPRGGPQGMDAPAPCEWHQYPGMYCRPISGDGTGDESVEACKTSCQQTRDCGAITWYSNQQRCYLAQGECEMADSGAALLQGAGSDSVVHTCDRVPTPSPTAGCDTTGTCQVYEDPHVKVFDGMQISLSGGGSHMHVLATYGAGDFWLVRTSDILIQARFLPDPDIKEKNLFVRAVAIGGPILNGSTLFIGPVLEAVTWQGSPVLEDQDSVLRIDGLLYAKRHNDSHLVQDMTQMNPGVDVELKQGVNITVNRRKKHVNVFIEMPPAVGGQQGLCGNFNCNPADDHLETILKERDPRVSPGDSLFVDAHDFQGEYDQAAT